MRFSIRAKQIAGVTLIVGVAVVGLTALYATRLTSVVLLESYARGDVQAKQILHRARQVVAESAVPYEALRADPGLLAILEGTLYSKGVAEAAMLDRRGIVIAHFPDKSLVGRTMPDRPDLGALVRQSPLSQLRVIYSEDGRAFEVRRSEEPFGSARIVISTVLVRDELDAALGPALVAGAGALVVAVIAAGLLAQIFLRPIHVIRSGLTRLGRGEFGVTLNLPPGDEFGELGTFFDSVSQQLADKQHSAGAGPAQGAGAAMGQSSAEQLQSTLAYSRKLVALGRLTAGIAHEVKNPLNAMIIHLELLRTKLRGLGVSAPEPVGVAGGTLGLSGREEALPAPVQSAMEHVHVIEKEIRRLDEVVQGFLKFTRPEDLRLQPVGLRALFEEIRDVVAAEAAQNRVRVVIECPASLPDVSGDAAMLRQAFLNLAINACQAMPGGGTLRLIGAAAADQRVEARIEDTGEGIAPEHLSRIFDLYFTTKDHGTGIGLSMVFRIVQMHDGEIEVQSTPGRGTTFRVLLPRAG